MTMITGIPFEIARDMAYFELHKDLTALSKADPTGSPSTKMKALNRLREYEEQSKEIFHFGLEKSKLEEILEDFKTNPLSLQSCANVEKQTYMIGEMELLLSDNYDKNGFVLRLIKSYGYNDEQAQKFQDNMLDEIKKEGKLVLSVFDKINERCKELTAK